MIHIELKFLTICHFHIHFHLTAISEVDEMYENEEEMVPKIAISDKNTIKKNHKSKLYNNYHGQNQVLIWQSSPYMKD